MTYIANTTIKDRSKNK